MTGSSAEYSYPKAGSVALVRAGARRRRVALRADCVWCLLLVIGGRGASRRVDGFHVYCVCACANVSRCRRALLALRSVARAMGAKAAAQS